MSARSDAARDILSVPLFADLMGEMEAAAINAAVYAKYDDDAARQAHLADVKAIRSLMSKITAVSKEDAEQPARKPVA